MKKILQFNISKFRDNLIFEILNKKFFIQKTIIFNKTKKVINLSNNYFFFILISFQIYI